MTDGMSYFSLAATALYALVALAAMAACGTAASGGQPLWNRNAWVTLALLFVVLIVLRGFGIEEMIRDSMRQTLRGDGLYEGRREVQGIVASVVLVAVAFAGGWWFYKATRELRGRRNVATMAALGAGGVMVFLVALRMISLHAIDKALYGAFKLNWIGDIGTSLIVLGAAVYYVRLVRARP